MSQSMAKNPEAIYDIFLSELEQVLGKVDPHLAVRVMYLEREFPDVSPSASLSIKYGDGTNLDRKRYDLNSKYGFLTSGEGHGSIRVTGRMDMKIIQELSSDPKVETISGSATPASY